MAYDTDLVIAEAVRSAGLVRQATETPVTQQLMQINSRYYHVAITKIERTINITDGENAGRTKPPVADMIRDIVGVFISYNAIFEVKGGDVNEYDDMILSLCDISGGKESIPVVMPFGQGSLAFDAYVTKIHDELLSNFGGVRRWGNCSVEFTPMRAQIKP